MSNYKAMVAKVDTVQEIPGRDAIQIGTVLGEQVIISKNVKVGDIGILFVSGTQLSPEFCKENNLYRDTTLNRDPTAKPGYFEPSRRVRAQPFAGVKSEALFTSLDTLSFIPNITIGDLTLGTSFEELGGVKICNKYLSEKTIKAAQANRQKTKSVKTVSAPFFEEHVETSQFKHHVWQIQKGDLVSIQAKVHGTSVRYANTKIEVTLPKWKQILNKIAPFFPTSYWDQIVGTRRVALLTNQPDKDGFHGSEQFRYDWLEKLRPHLKRGMTIYGEIAGFANGKPIMATHSTKGLKNKDYETKYGPQMIYKYGCLPDQSRFHVYRITYTTDSGEVVDFSQQQVVRWCNDRGFLPARDVVPPFIFDGDYDALTELVEKLTERPEVLTQDFEDPSHISEGVIIRVDSGNTTPKFFKSKSFVFKVLEGIAVENEVDLEDAS